MRVCVDVKHVEERLHVCVYSVDSPLENTDCDGLSHFFISIHQPPFSANNPEVLRHTCLWWKWGQIRTLFPTLTLRDALSRSCQATARVYLSHQMHDTLLSMFAAAENTDPRLQIASCVYFIPPGLNGGIVVLTHWLALKGPWRESQIKPGNKALWKRVSTERFFGDKKGSTARYFFSGRTLWSRAGRWQSDSKRSGCTFADVDLILL